MIDPTKIKAYGPWVLLRRLKPLQEEGLERRGSLFIPNGTIEEKLGYAKAEVVSVGSGVWDKVKKRRWLPGFEVGDVIYHRGYLAEINTLSPLDDTYAFIHIDDVMLVFE